MSAVRDQLHQAYHAIEQERREEAETILRPLAEQGVAQAQHLLGWVVGKKTKAARSHGEALKLFREAVRNGCLHSYKYIGLIFELGQGVPQNKTYAVACYHTAAYWGDSQAQNKLGILYRDGVDVRRDLDHAFHWFFEAARRGNTEGLCNLANLFKEGVGVGKDLVQSALFFDLAMGLGCPKAKKFFDEVLATMTTDQQGRYNKHANGWRKSFRNGAH